MKSSWFQNPFFFFAEYDVRISQLMLENEKLSTNLSLEKQKLIEQIKNLEVKLQELQKTKEVAEKACETVPISPEPPKPENSKRIAVEAAPFGLNPNAQTFVPKMVPQAQGDGQRNRIRKH